MFGVNSYELMIVAVVALLVIGPKDLPVVLRKVGGWVSQARGVARHFRSGLDTMIRESELDEMEKTWARENERIMREHPMDETHAPMTDPSLIPPVQPATEADAPTVAGPSLAKPEGERA